MDDRKTFSSGEDNFAELLFFIDDDLMNTFNELSLYKGRLSFWRELWSERARKAYMVAEV